MVSAQETTMLAAIYPCLLKSVVVSDNMMRKKTASHTAIELEGLLEN